jgi:hypothetical protein
MICICVFVYIHEYTHTKWIIKWFNHSSPKIEQDRLTEILCRFHLNIIHQRCKNVVKLFVINFCCLEPLLQSGTRDRIQNRFRNEHSTVCACVCIYRTRPSEHGRGCIRIMDYTLSISKSKISIAIKVSIINYPTIILFMLYGIYYVHVAFCFTHQLFNHIRYNNNTPITHIHLSIKCIQML